MNRIRQERTKKAQQDFAILFLKERCHMIGGWRKRIKEAQQDFGVKYPGLALIKAKAYFRFSLIVCSVFLGLELSLIICAFMVGESITEFPTAIKLISGFSLNTIISALTCWKAREARQRVSELQACSHKSSAGKGALGYKRCEVCASDAV